MKLLDTIAAVSTPRGKGGVAMIRISGADALDIGARIFRPFRGASLPETDSAKMRYGEIISPEDNTVIDDGMAAIFRAPSSFTGEDTVEIYCHGGTLVTQRVLCSALLAGARAAEAGEFTRRAFVAGKLSLSGAEALGTLLDAKTDGQLRLARNGMREQLGAEISELYDVLRSVLSSIYAAIDFPDEDLAELSRDDIRNRLNAVLTSLKSLAATYSTGRAITEGITTVICGRTNAGKSSVYNRILGCDAAIVTDVEGTTRDVLRATAALGHTTLLLCDTAGLRQTADTVEGIGIARAVSVLSSAELVLAVFDASRPLDSDDRTVIGKISSLGAKCIALLNKKDVGVCAEAEREIRAAIPTAIAVCAKTGDGFDTLAEETDRLFIDGSLDLDNDAVIIGARQYSAVALACERLEVALNELISDTPLDLCCTSVEAAMAAMGEIDGREISEDIVSEIFSKFCVGK